MAVGASRKAYRQWAIGLLLGMQTHGGLFQPAMFWKLPVRVALVFCAIMSEGLELAVRNKP